MRQLKNNKGLSLIEVIVAVAIVSILFLGIASFMQSSTTYYGRTKKETKLQNESQMVYRTVSDVIKNANVFQDGAESLRIEGTFGTKKWIMVKEDHSGIVNDVYKVGKCPREYAEGLIKMISCISPHIGEEIWEKMGHTDTIAFESWPTYDESKIAEDTVEIAVQINGKVKATLAVGADEEEASVKEKAHAIPAIAGLMEGKNVVKEIYVKGRILNIVVK